MTVPVNNVSLLDLQNEFGGSGIISLSEYYAGGPYVSNPPPTSNYQTGPIPTSGPISLGCFRGVTKITPVVLTPPAYVDMYGHSRGDEYQYPFQYNNVRNATNLHFLFTASGGLPAQNSGASYSWWWEYKPGSNTIYSFQISQPQDSTGSWFPIPANTPNNSIMDFWGTGDNGGNPVTILLHATDGITTATYEFIVGFYW